MRIAEMFAKPIDRNIQGVIKVGQDNDVRTELDEYVVTNELQDQFAKFFAAYTRALHGPTDEMGVWISGFFGSGKSHFLKVLAYILSNRVVDGKPAVEFFADKINDPIVYGQMQAAADANTDVILFNIDAKAMSGEKHDTNVIIDVFLQVFNEMQGYSNKNEWIADMERQLDAAGRLDDFKKEFKALEHNHLDWQMGRDHYSMNKGTIKDTLIKIGFMSEEDAQGFIENLFNPYRINIEDFAKLVNNFITKTGRRVAFLVDEVGQFVGDSVQRMLNLQTVVEELGMATQGKAWVIVTSQQAIGEVTSKLNGQDFSKIQGRFKTRIALSSANVDEVIRRRLLAKTEIATNELSGLYGSNAAALNNAIDFDDGVTRQRFDSAADFATNYPFVPYQFNLLQDVLTAVRNHGSDGKNLSEGERSMLSIFQESAMRKMQEPEGTLIPFSLFFEGLAQFLDHTHSIVVQRARENKTLNPSGEYNPFVLQVLKTLFMVKYLKSFKADLNNLVTLMIGDINEDRIALTERTQEALNALIKEGIVEKHIDVYVFLTDAEQDINSGIEHEQIDDSAVTEALQQYLFGTKAIADRFMYPKLHDRYTFSFNRWLDGKPYGRTNNSLTIKVITSQDDYYGEESAYVRQSLEQDTLVVVLPDDQSYIQLITRSQKIKAYVLGNANNQDTRFQLLLGERRQERSTLDQAAKGRALNALEQAQIYVAGAPIGNNRDFSSRLEEAEKELVDNNYRYLDYIDAAKSEHDITQTLADDGLVKTTENGRAAQAVMDWLQLQLKGTQHITLKTVLIHFAGIPFGYTLEDTQWLIAALFKDGKIKLTYNGETISLMQDTPKEVTDYLTKKQFAEKIAIQVRAVVSSRDLKLLREVAGDVFNKHSFSAQDSETVARELLIQVKSNYKTLQLLAQKNRNYPGHDLVEQGLSLVQKLTQTNDTDDFIAAVIKHANELLDWHDDYVSTETYDFYFDAPSQQTWDHALNDLQIYKRSKDYINNAQLKQVVGEIKTIVDSNRPKGKVTVLRDLHTQFDDLFSKEFDKAEAEQLAEIDKIKQDGLDYIDSRQNVDGSALEKKRDQFVNAVKRLRTDATGAHAVDELNLATSKARAQYKIMVRAVNNLPETVSGDDNDHGSESSTNGQPTEEKVVHTLTARQVISDSQWRITNNYDIDRYLDELRGQLQKKLAEANEIDIKF